MSHLSRETLYRLAGLVTWDMGFGEQDVIDMTHIRTCESCYRKLCANMAIMEAVDEFGFADVAELEQTHCDSRKVAARRKETARVEIALTVDRFCAELAVISAAGGWSFAAAVAQCGQSSRMTMCQPSRLEDMADSNTFLEVDPLDQRLVIRLSEELAARKPCAFLVTPEGEKRTIRLTGDPSGVKLPALPEGSYRLILEK